MAKQNKVTHKAQQQALIDRTPPYDANPLIQKTEDDEVRDQGIDNVVYQVSTVGTIGSPAAAFACDFATNDEYNIDTSGSGSSAFSITLSNLEGNSVGKLNIIKKTGDTFVFANGTILPSNGTNGQTGLTTIAFMVVKAGATYNCVPLYNSLKGIIDNSATSLIKRKVVNIGDWNMQSTATVAVAHGITNYKNILNISVIIRDDADSLYSPINAFDTGIVEGGVGAIGVTNITLGRAGGSFYNSASYNSTSYNRGSLYIEYLE